MKKLIIFDLDGTLIDTLEDLKNAVNYALEHFHYPLRSKEQIRQAIGNGVAKLVERSIPEGINNPNYPECLKIFKEYYAIHYADCTIPYKGVYELVCKLKQDGYILAVATNKIVEIAEILINKCYPNLFDYIQGDCPEVEKKPSPDMINRIREKYHVTKEEIFYLGDTNVDEETALNSGVDYLIETYGYRTKEEIQQMCKSKVVLDTPEQIYEYIKSRG